MTSLPDHIFKAYDIRGVVGEALTEEVVGRIGQGLGTLAMEAGDSALIIARDGRLSGPELAEALARGVNRSGCDVIDIGAVPTPLLYFATHTLGSRSGVAVTGSHNPPQYNGLKMVIGGITLAGDAITGLKRRIENGDLGEGAGNRGTAAVIDAYIRRICEDVAIGRPLRLVMDCGNGIAGAVAPELFRSLGIDVVQIYCEVDGSFPNHHPDPSQPENLADLIAAVRREKADLGFAFDGDGDRLGVVTARGDIIWPDRQMMLFSRAVLERHPGAPVIYDVKCSQLLPREIERLGGTPMMWRTGHSLIKARLRETGAPLAGEMSGHIFFNDRWYGFDDGLYSGARLCELLTASGQDIQAQFDELPDSINTPELKIEMNEGENHALIERLKESIRFDDARVSTIDGVRVDFDHGFGLARASNTTPSVILRFEAVDQAHLDLIKRQFARLLLNLDSDLVLPF